MLSMLAILGAFATAHGRPAVGTALLATTPPLAPHRVGGGGSSHEHQRLRRQVATTTAADAGDDLDDYPLLSAIFIGLLMAVFFSFGASLSVYSVAATKKLAALKADDDAEAGSAVATVTDLIAATGEYGTYYTASYSFTSADGARVTANEDISYLPFAGGVRTAGQWHQWKHMHDSHTAVETPVR